MFGKATKNSSHFYFVRSIKSNQLFYILVGFVVFIVCLCINMVNQPKYVP